MNPSFSSPDPQGGRAAPPRPHGVAGGSRAGSHWAFFFDGPTGGSRRRASSKAVKLGPAGARHRQQRPGLQNRVMGLTLLPNRGINGQPACLA